MKAPLPANEEARLAALQSYQILDTLPEQAYDDIVRLASHICQTPIATVTLVDQDRQWFKSVIGLGDRENPREVSFCAHALLEPEELFVVADARLDSRFADNPLVTGDPHIAFYAGAPLVTPEGQALGTLCVIDRQPRQLSPEQKEALHALSRQIEALFELRRNLILLEQQRAVLNDYQERLEQANARLQVLADRDELTQLGNRRSLMEHLEVEYERSKRYPSRFRSSCLMWITSSFTTTVLVIWPETKCCNNWPSC